MVIFGIAKRLLDSKTGGTGASRSERLILKLGYIRYIYNYSGSRWHVGAPKDLDTMSILGFPTYKTASMLTLGTRFVSDPQRLGTAPSGLPSTQKRQVTGEWV